MSDINFYKLKLLKNIKKISSALLSCFMKDSDDEIQIMYEVQAIEGKRIQKNQTQYQIKWKGFSQRTWEPLKHLQNISDMIYQYQQAQKERRKANKTQNQEKKKIHKQTQPVPIKKKLNKISDKILQTESPNIKKSFEQQINSRQYLVQALSDKQSSKGPPVKFAQSYLDQFQQEKQGKQFGNIYVNQIQRIEKIQKKNGKWLLLVKFYENYQDSWQQRDIVRMLYPLKVLIFYEQLYKQKKTDK